MKIEVTGYKEPLDALINSAEKADAELTTKLGEHAKQSFARAYNMIMDDFYSYGPFPSYKRTGNLRKIGRPYIRKSGTSVSAGLSVNSDYAKKIYKKYHSNPKGCDVVITTNEVMDLMWNHGFRGLPKGYIGSTNYAVALTITSYTYLGNPHKVMSSYYKDYSEKILPDAERYYIETMFHL